MNATEAFAALAKLSPALRIGLAAGAIVVILGSIAFAVFSHGAPVALFARPLDATQLAEVEERLAEWNVAFTPQSDNVLIDAKRRNGMLLKLSLSGVPHEHVATTSEALANVGVLTPQAIIDEQTRSGLAGEIELALRSVEGVDDATVIIAPAKSAEYADENGHDGSASVRLRLKPGARLTQTAIAGIRAYVAASVAGLDATHVTILDDRGLALGDENAVADDPSALEHSLQSALDDVLGAGVAVVRVHAEYSSATSEHRETRRAPLGDAITRSVQNEAFDGAGRRYRKNEEHDDRGSAQTESVTHVGPGSLVRLNAAIFVDATRAFDLAKVRELAAAAMGYDARRGDTLSVQAVEFHKDLQPKHDGFFWLYGALVSMLPTIAVFVAIIVVVRTVLPHVSDLAKNHLERAATERTAKMVAGFAPAQVRGALAHEPPHAAAAIISALPAATAAAVLELYPQHEREAIVARMQRAHSPFIPQAQELFGRHA